MSPLRDEALKMHKEKQGKIGVYPKVKVQNSTDLSLAYSPGVAEPCLEIYKDESKVFDYTMKGNLVGVISDGTAVLGLGNIGPKAAMPVMEGKALLFKSFAEIDAFPICLNTNNPDKIVEVVKLLEPNFGGINLEDIAAPQCFEIEERLRKSCDIPIFHDDQHGTAIVTIAGLINALKLTNKKIEDVQIVVNGAGAAGIAIVKLLLHMHVKNVILCDTKGIIYEKRPIGMNALKEEIARITNVEQKQGTLAEALIDADVFIGVSAADVVDEDMIHSMNHNPIIFALANPTPEIMPNQVNNVLAFPGVFRGALDVQAKEINEEMKLAAVYAIADLISEEELHVNYVIPNPFDPRVVPHVAYAVARAAVETGVARKNISMSEIKNNLLRLIKEEKVLK
ncbi:NAD(P)-dependent malic enzyme [Bacillus cereus group sp. MYBK150-2]|uniref:NAD(P)-dependent malic enzyme n=1 Tax=Bacillus cereus group sp. MYBK150-2 TaxID=3450679 RepID=UPI003F79220A